jgi:hypothetical protein
MMRRMRVFLALQRRTSAEFGGFLRVSLGVSLGALLLCAIPAECQGSAPAAGNGKDAAYFNQVFASHNLVLPHMAWIAAPDSLLASSKFPQVFAYVPGIATQACPLQQMVDSSVAQDLRRRLGILCDDVAYFRYHADGLKTEPPMRALATSTRIPESGPSGFHPVELKAKQLAEAIGALQCPKFACLHQEFALAGNDRRNVYAFVAIYDRRDRQLFNKGMFLFSGGKLVGRHIEGPADCDGCSDAPYGEPLEGAYPVLNLYSFSDFAYPVLLLDTSTTEGQALSLVTFDPEQRFAEYRVYEYVVNCGATEH